MAVPKTIQIFVLDKPQKTEIREKLYSNLIKLGIQENELEDAMENGMDSRLCDLEDAIDIYSLNTAKVI